MLIKGSFEFEIGGVTRGFKFGMLASEYFCESEKITIAEMQDRLSNPTPGTAINCAYASAKAYCDSKDIKVDFKRSDVADWLDEIGIDVFFNKIYQSLEVYQDADSKKPKKGKNVKAPK